MWSKQAIVLKQLLKSESCRNVIFYLNKSPYEHKYENCSKLIKMATFAAYKCHTHAVNFCYLLILQFFYAAQSRD